MTLSNLNKPIIRDVIRQELQDQLIIERVKKGNLKRVLREVLKHDQTLLPSCQLPQELIYKIIKYIREY